MGRRGCLAALDHAETVNAKRDGASTGVVPNNDAHNETGLASLETGRISTSALRLCMCMALQVPEAVLLPYFKK
jgi:hypothetical protein